MDKIPEGYDDFTIDPRTGKVELKRPSVARTAFPPMRRSWREECVVDSPALVRQEEADGRRNVARLQDADDDVHRARRRRRRRHADERAAPHPRRGGAPRAAPRAQA